MRFCDKLPKLRKDNNITQEQLADKLKVSRQAVSKWELGSSYPDMEKLLQLCSVLNCTLDDLMDDGALGEKVNQNTKFNFNDTLNDLLKFITKTYNMLCSMKWKEKIKCFIEMIFIAFILYIIGFAITQVIFSLTRNVINLLPQSMYYPLSSIFYSIYLVIIIILALIIFIHLFKIRYLDYFVTVEDKTVTKKTIEKAVETKKYVEKEKEKIIIRDPKHSTFKFFNVLGKIVLFFIKLLVLMIAIPFVATMITLAFLSAVSIWHIPYNIIFLFVLFIVIGISLINYSILEIIYKFITNERQHFKRIFILCITGLLIGGAGAGLTFTKALEFNYLTDNNDLNYKVDTKYIKVKDNTKIYEYLSFDNVDYDIDNSLKEIKIEISYLEDIGYTFYHKNYLDNDEYYISTKSYGPNALYKYILKDLKKGQLRNYDDGFVKVKLSLNQKDFDKLKENGNVIFYYDE